MESNITTADYGPAQKKEAVKIIQQAVKAFNQTKEISQFIYALGPGSRIIKVMAVGNNRREVFRTEIKFMHLYPGAAIYIAVRGYSARVLLDYGKRKMTFSKRRDLF